MIAIKGMEMPTDCKKCPLMGTDGIDKFSPMMCIAIWATTHEIKHCIGGKILDDCPLVEIVTCKDCKHWHNDGIMTTCDKNIGHGFPSDYFCADTEKRK